ncbi:dystrobrevin beta-like isoform X2 [Daktulosphaira vitifoliae]|uniref:dystrobrevin beta-like isoform X2 n=1 Tax=Daktulosphaira vitifoliae TaxID=58002 RepID=UPI0021AA0841|nr:dystrobrevin beta-like isoform X2 [Daktulosphaira vitifoliae]
MSNKKEIFSDSYLHLLQEMKSENYDLIRFASYRTACKLRYIQKKLFLHILDIWNIIEAFRENGLNILESHVEVDIYKLENVISSLYFNLNKRLPSEQLVDADQLTIMLLNWIISVYSLFYQALYINKNYIYLYHRNKTIGRIRVLSIKISLAIMCSGKLMDKYRYIFSQICDQNGHLIAWKFREFLIEVLALPAVVFESPSFQYTEKLPSEIFVMNNNVTVNDFMNIMMSDPGPACLVWLPLLHRLANIENVVHPISCNACQCNNFIGFRYRCQKCHNFQMCQECFWKGNVGSSHSIEHDVKEYTSYKSPSKHIGHSIRKSIHCVPEKEKANIIPQFPNEPEKTINLSHIIPPSPLLNHYGFSEVSLNSQFNTLDSKNSSASPDIHAISLDYNSMDDEHKLIARYAARLAAEAKSVGKVSSEGFLSLDTSKTQRELIMQLELKNREILREITILKQQQAMDGFSSGMDENPALMDELFALRNRKHELESHLTSLQDSRKQLMVQLENLMKLLRNHQDSPQSTIKSLSHSKKVSKSAPPTPDALLNSISTLSFTSTYDTNMIDDAMKSVISNTSNPNTSEHSSMFNSKLVSSESRNLREDLLVAADSVTNAMSSLVQELNSDNPVQEFLENLSLHNKSDYCKKEVNLYN